MKINIGGFIYIMDKREQRILIKGSPVKIEKDESTIKILLDTGYEITILSDEP